MRFRNPERTNEAARLAAMPEMPAARLVQYLLAPRDSSVSLPDAGTPVAFGGERLGKAISVRTAVQRDLGSRAVATRRLGGERTRQSRRSLSSQTR